MNKRDILIGILAFGLFIEWGERSTLQSRFEDYLSGLHWPDAHAKCSEAARAGGAKIVIDKANYWRPEGLMFGIAPWGWPWRYFQWGRDWNLDNSFPSLRYAFYEDPRWYVCEYNPAGGGHARVSATPND
jgi:hypothetical protein